MTLKKIIVPFLISLIYTNVSAQTCTIRISDKIGTHHPMFAREIKTFLSLEFEFNNVRIKATDSNSITIKPNQLGFDTVKYSYDYGRMKHTDTFICKLRANEVYTISLCTCCGIFLITPSDYAKRGFVKYINRSQKQLIARTSDISEDTIRKKSHTDYLYSSISMNCGFRPNLISILGSDNSDDRNRFNKKQKILNNESPDHVVYAFNFLFLHGEKLIVFIGKSGKDFKLKLFQ